MDDFLLRDGTSLTVTAMGSLTEQEIITFGESCKSCKVPHSLKAEL